MARCEQFQACPICRPLVTGRMGPHRPNGRPTIEALLLVSRGGPAMLARIGVMRALNRGHVREFTSSSNGMAS